MRIARVEAIPLAIPFTYGRGSERTLDFCLVRVETDTGLVGWGEAFSYHCRSAVAAALNDMIAPLAVGRDVAEIASLSIEIQKSLHIFGRFGIAAFALSGLDIALWDIAGKAAGVPLHNLLGAGQRGLIPCYASLLRYSEPKLIAKYCEQALCEGYTALKLHEISVEAVAVARSTVGAELPLMLDVNCEWTVGTAITMGKRLWAHHLDWLEEPVFPPEDFRGLRAVGEASGIAIACGENLCFVTQFAALVEARAATVAQPSVTKVGGITEFLKVVKLAKDAGWRVAPHSPYFGPGALATLHLLAAWVPEARFEYFYLSPEAKLYGDLLDPQSGSLGVPAGPGLGMDPDPDVIRRYRG